MRKLRLRKDVSGLDSEIQNKRPFNDKKERKTKNIKSFYKGYHTHQGAELDSKSQVLTTVPLSAAFLSSKAKTTEPEPSSD